MQNRLTRATVSITSTIARVLKAQGRQYEAFQRKLEVYEFTAVEYGYQHIYTLIALDNLLDPMNPETITVMMNTATILSRLKRLDEALI